MPAPAARRRSTSVPCGTSSKVTSPFRISSSAGDEPPALAVNETIRCRTRPASTRVWAPGGIVLPTKQRSLVPRSSSAASRLKGAPALGPKPETAIEAPSGRSLIASAGEVRSLSMCLACVAQPAVTKRCSESRQTWCSRRLLARTSRRGRVTLPVSRGGDQDGGSCMSGGADLVHVLVAVVLAYAIGFERDLRGAGAGDRTFGLIGLGAGIVGVLTVHGAADALAGVLTGVGFIGAALLFRQERPDIVRGLTTAASILAGVA